MGLGLNWDSVKQFTEEIFIFVERVLSPKQREAFTKALLIYIFQVFKLNQEELKTFNKKVIKMTGIVPGSVYDKAIKKGIEHGIEQGTKKGDFIRLVISIQRMTLKELDITFIAEINDISKEEVQTIQKDLQKSEAILKQLSKGKTISDIASKHKVSNWFIEAIRQINEKRNKA